MTHNALLGSQTLLNNSQPMLQPEPNICKEIVPGDLGEKVLVWLEPNNDGGLTLNYEKHQVISYGMASVPVIVE